MNGGQPPLTYKRFQALISCMEAVDSPAETITTQVLKNCTTPISDDHDDKFAVPSLEELGKSLSQCMSVAADIQVVCTNSMNELKTLC